MRPTIVIDAMGGDNAPDEVVAGTARASLALPDVQLILVGDETRIEALLRRLAHVRDSISIRHTDTVIGMDEAPAAALAAKPDASVCVAADLVAGVRECALVSAGNTGATVLACTRRWALRPGVRRAAFAAVVPTQVQAGLHNKPFSLILDVGATIEANAADLVAFALMGSAYTNVVSPGRRPRVALLSNGAESSKGPREVVEAHAVLAQLDSIDFVGNIEGFDIPRGLADVIVCSGFVGNVVVKMLEGVAGTARDLARDAYRRNLIWRAGLLLLSGAIRRLHHATDWRGYGGAPLLGFNELCIKAHGRSEATALTNAIQVAHTALSANLNGQIGAALDNFATTVSRPPAS